MDTNEASTSEETYRLTLTITAEELTASEEEALQAAHTNGTMIDVYTKAPVEALMKAKVEKEASPEDADSVYPNALHDLIDETDEVFRDSVKASWRESVAYVVTTAREQAEQIVADFTDGSHTEDEVRTYQTRSFAQELGHHAADGAAVQANLMPSHWRDRTSLHPFYQRLHDVLVRLYVNVFVGHLQAEIAQALPLREDPSAASIYHVEGR